MIEIGVDDAGRGVLIGPLVMAGTVVTEKGVKRLRGLRVQDSKNYKNAKTVVNRFMEIGSVVEKFTVRLITAQEMDENNAKKISIDRSMIPHIIDMVEELGKEQDNPDVFIDNIQHKDELIAELKSRGFEKVTVESGGERHISVAAASIVASAQFELELRKLRLEWGDLGSGNPNDPKTIKWLKNYYKKEKKWPYFVRTFYKTLKRLEAESR
jgi:ribonuclease HII